MPDRVVKRRHDALNTVFGSLEDHQAGKPLQDRLNALLAESANPGPDVVDVAVAAMSVLVRLVEETAGSPAATARRIAEMRIRWSLHVLQLAREEVDHE